MKTSTDKEIFLEMLEETPLISVAAKRAGIAKATIYRWKKKNSFSKKIEKVLEKGREIVSDRVESVLIKKALAGERWAVQMWLENNRKKYIKPRRPIVLDFPKEKIDKIIVQTLLPRVVTDKDLEEMRKRKEEGGNQN